MSLGKKCGLMVIVGCAIITVINMYHDGEPLPLVALLAAIGAIEYVVLLST